jgi:predicted negative regulator of RcsB-dependent stress response
MEIITYISLGLVIILLILCIIAFVMQYNTRKRVDELDEQSQKYAEYVKTQSSSTKSILDSAEFDKMDPDIKKAFITNITNGILPNILTAASKVIVDKGYKKDIITKLNALSTITVDDIQKQIIEEAKKAS